MNSLGSIEALKQKASASPSPSVITTSTDPAVKTKEEQAKRLETLITELGKAMKQLLEGSEEHEVWCFHNYIAHS